MEAILADFISFLPTKHIYKTSFLKTLAQEQLNKEVIAGLVSRAKDVNNRAADLHSTEQDAEIFKRWQRGCLSMMVNAFTLRTQEKSGLHCEFHDSQGYIERPHLKTKTKQNKEQE